MSKGFQKNKRWIAVKIEMYRLFPKVCMACGRESEFIEIDHVKPKSKYPYLALDIRNLQVLCKPCNQRKSNLDETDYRSEDDFLSILDTYEKSPFLKTFAKSFKKRGKNKKRKRKKAKEQKPVLTRDEQILRISQII